MPNYLAATNINATTLPLAARLTGGIGNPTVTSTPTLVGTATGYGEIIPVGALGTAWPALDAPDDATGRGFLDDSTYFEGQEIVAGLWSVTLTLSCTGAGPSPTLTADLYVRAFNYNAQSGAFVAIGAPFLLPAVTLTTTAQVLTFPALAQPAAFFGTGDKVYFDLWANVTLNNAGSSGATITLGNLSTTTSDGSANAAWTLPPYQQQTSAQEASAYSYGDFQLHDLVNYYVVGKTFAMPEYKQSLYKIARLPGMKKSGETVDAVTIPLTVRIVGASRADLEGKIDALLQAVALRQQPLLLHTIDARVWTCDSVKASVDLPPGAVVSALASLAFVAQQPYALGPARTFNYGPAAMALVSGTSYQFAQIGIIGRGTVAAPPNPITLTNNTPTNNNVLGASLTSGSNYTSLTIASPGMAAAATAGEVFQLDDGAGHTQQVTVATGGAAQGATTLPVNSFQANFSYPAVSTTGVYLVTYISALTITQLADNLSLIISPTPGGFISGHSLVITCDPAATNGWTVLLDGTGSPQPFAGVFPVQEPYATNWNVEATCVNVPTLAAAWTWQPRYLA